MYAQSERWKWNQAAWQGGEASLPETAQGPETAHGSLRV